MPLVKHQNLFAFMRAISGFARMTNVFCFSKVCNILHACISPQKTTETEDQQTDGQVVANPEQYIKHPLQNRWDWNGFWLLIWMKTVCNSLHCSLLTPSSVLTTSPPAEQCEMACVSKAVIRKAKLCLRTWVWCRDQKHPDTRTGVSSETILKFALSC